jgi:hypothetical protein
MKRRTQDYMDQKKAFRKMLHPENLDLKSFLIAEFDSSHNIVVKKDILKIIDQLDHPMPVTTEFNTGL